jgi:hypothetical protein
MTDLKTQVKPVENAVDNSTVPAKTHYHSLALQLARTISAEAAALAGVLDRAAHIGACGNTAGSPNFVYDLRSAHERLRSAGIELHKIARTPATE